MTYFKILYQSYQTIRSGAYKEEGKFIQWVMRIAHNLIIDYFRKAKRIPLINNDNSEFDIFDTIKFTDPSIEEQIITDQIHEDVRSLIELLPAEQKEVLLCAIMLR